MDRLTYRRDGRIQFADAMVRQPAATYETNVDAAIRQFSQESGLGGNIQRVDARRRNAGWTKARPLDMGRHKQERSIAGMVGRIAIDGHRVKGVLIDQFRQINIISSALVRLESDAEFAIRQMRLSFAIIALPPTIIASADHCERDWDGAINAQGRQQFDLTTILC